jgi:hypothetical protein
MGADTVSAVEAALEYLERGWSIIPADPDSKKPYVQWTEFQHRRPTEDQVRSWWASRPRAVPAVVCGEVSGIVVLDLDDQAAWHHFEDRTPYTLQATTPKEYGLHRFYSYDGEGSRNLRSHGLAADVKGDGGYVLLPPGPGRTWLNRGEWEGRALPPIPPRSLPETERIEQPTLSGSSPGPAHARLIEALEKAGMRGSGSEWTCPAHDDRNPSLSVNPGGVGVVVKCHSGCSVEAVCAALDLTVSDLFDEPLAAGQERDTSPAKITVVRDRLEVVDFRELERRVKDAGTPSWLVEGLWPSDAYGVLGAEDKAGKTWAELDLAVSVATGTPWLGKFACSQGPVVVYLGEGGARNTRRRIRAIAESKGIDPSDLHGILRVCLAVPNLTSEKDLARVRADLEAHPARLLNLDPLYLAAGGSNGSQLYEMGNVLGALQAACQDTAEALTVTHHWTKTGEGKDHRRFTGVGPGAWGRVLGSAALEQTRTEPDRTSVVTLKWSFVGGEIAPTEFRMTRTVRATDPNDLVSPLVYVVAASEGGGDEGANLSPPRLRVLAALSEDKLTIRQIGDRVARDTKGKPLTADTINRSLAELAGKGLADGEQPGIGLPGLWWATPARLGGNLRTSAAL